MQASLFNNYQKKGDQEEVPDYISYRVDTSGMGDVPVYNEPKNIERISRLTSDQMIGGGGAPVCADMFSINTSALSNIFSNPMSVPPSLIDSIWSDSPIATDKSFIPEENQIIQPIHSAHVSKEVKVAVTETLASKGITSYQIPDTSYKTISELEKRRGEEEEEVVVEEQEQVITLQNESPPKPKKRRTWKTVQYQQTVKDRAQKVIALVHKFLEEDYIRFYEDNDPLLYSRDSNTFRNFLLSFEYAYATEPFRFSINENRNIEIPRQMVVVYKGMCFFSCSILQEFAKYNIRKVAEKMKKYIQQQDKEEDFGNPLGFTKVLQKNDTPFIRGEGDDWTPETKHFAIKSVKCKGVSLNGLCHLRKRNLISAYGLFMALHWLILTDSYKEYVPLYRQFLKYLDVEFGAFRGAMQFSPFTHSLTDLGLSLQDGEEKADAYTRYCIKQFEIIRDGNNYPQSEFHRGCFSKSFLDLETVPAMIPTNTDNNTIQCVSKNSGSTGKRKRRDGSNRGESPTQKRKDKRKKQDSDSVPEESDGKILSEGEEEEEEEEDKREQLLPFSFKIKLEINRKRYSPVIKNFLVVPSFDAVRIDHDNIDKIAFGLDEHNSIIEGLSSPPSVTVRQPTEILKALKRFGMDTYSGSSAFSESEKMDHVLRNGGGMGMDAISDASYRVTSLMKQESPYTKKEEELKDGWYYLLSEAIHYKNRDFFTNTKKHRRYTPRCFFRFNCIARTIRGATDLDLTDTTKNLSRFGLPIVEERKRAIFSLMNSYLFRWPEQMICIKMYQRSTEFAPFWMLTFFVLSMNKKEQKANGSPLRFCYRVLESFKSWFSKKRRAISENYSPEEVKGMLRGTKLFKQSLLLVEMKITDPTLSSVFHMSSSLPMNISHVLAGLLKRTIEERDALLIFLVDTLIPLMKQNNMNDMVCMQTPPLVMRNIKRLLDYAQEMYTGPEERAYRRRLDQNILEIENNHEAVPEESIVTLTGLISEEGSEEC